MLGYTNKPISTAEMIARLLELVKWVREAKKHGQELGLDQEEVAFYDALAENGSAKEVMQSDQLPLMARALAEMVGACRGKWLRHPAADLHPRNLRHPSPTG